MFQPRHADVSRADVELLAPRTLVVEMAAKHRPTYDHMCRVAIYAERLAQRLKLPPGQVREARNAGLLHDIGKLPIPVAILSKATCLDSVEADVLRSHAAEGADMLMRMPGLAVLSDAVRYHHEWYSGEGYPTGLAGKSIPLLSRMIAIIDTFDAMLAPGPSSQPLTWHAALAKLQGCSGTQIDTEITSEFTEMCRKAAQGKEPWLLNRDMTFGK